MIDVAATLGVDARSSPGIAYDELAGARVPERAVVRLWETLETESGDPFIGLHIAERASSGAWGLLAYAIRSCATLDDAWTRVRRWWPLLFTGSDEIIDVERGERVLGYRRLPGGNPLVPASEDCIVASFVLACRAAVGASFRPTRAHLQRSAPGLDSGRAPSAGRPGDGSEHRRVLGCPVVFGASFNGIEIPSRVLRAPLPSHDPHLVALLDGLAEAKLAAVATHASLAELVSAWLERRIDARAPIAVEDAARAFQRSVRSFQRSLAEEDTSYRELVDDARRRIAIGRIHVVGAKQLASDLGFADATHLYRAFVRWTGRTVAEYRRADH